MDGFRVDKLIEVLDVNIKELNRSNMDDIVGLFLTNNDLNDFIKPNVTYCPVCIKNGYHSMWHQISIFDKCFTHDVKLNDTCPGCGKPREYRFKASPNQYGFKCLCGYSYLEKLNDVYFVKWKSDESIFSTDQMKWVKVNRKLKDSYKLYSYNLRKNLATNQDFRNKLFINIRNMEYDIAECNDEPLFHEILPGIKNIKAKCNQKDKNVDIEAELYHSYKSILKSIARRIRKVNKNGVKIINKVKKDMYSSSYDNLNSQTALSYAYLMWRGEVEGHTSSANVHERIIYLHRDNFRITGLQVIISESKFYKYFINELYTLLKKSSHYSWTDCLCLLEHMMAYTFISHYNNWVEHIIKMIDKGEQVKIEERIDFETLVFLTKYPEDVLSKDALLVYCLNIGERRELCKFS